MVSSNDETRTSRDETSDTLVDTPGSRAAGSHPDRIGRYEVLGELGRGGMGVVYRARDPELDRALAIKVVVPIDKRERSRQRLLDEARALAKLQHPAVVPVFDVGAVDDGVYIVMPLVAGGTMYEWGKEPHPWREVLARYVAAGRGLAAAHAAGLVHRDFKPRNVLVGEGGQVMVADFGIAATTDDSLDGSSPPTTPGGSSVQGTPAYMAPEQATGQPVDARADQYSFCIAFWEALHGQRPQDAATRSPGVVPTAVVPTVPAGRRGAPGWLLAAIARGFSTTPGLRWPSMTALLEHLERRMRRPRRVALTVGVIVALATATTVTAVSTSSNRGNPCKDPAVRFAAVWGVDARARVQRAIVASNLPDAQTIAERTLATLDDYVLRWRSASVEACRASTVDRRQSGYLFDQRQVCLDRRLGALDALTRELGAGTDRQLSARAVQAASDLPDIADCARTEALLAVEPLPGSALRRTEIEKVQRELDAISAVRRGGDPIKLLERSRVAVEAARAADYKPVLARALHLLAMAEYDGGTTDTETLRELADVAAATGDDRATAEATIGMVTSLTKRSSFSEAKALEPVARASLARAGSLPVLEWELEMAIGVRSMRSQELDAARTHFQRAADIAPDGGRRSDANHFLAKVALGGGDPELALKLGTKALAEFEATWGPQHPDTASVRVFLAQVHVMRGEYGLAEESARRAHEMIEAVFGPDDPRLITNLKTLVFVLVQTGRMAEARPIAEHALKLAEVSTDALKIAAALDSIAEIVGKLEGPSAALPYFERALPLLEQKMGKDKPFYVQVENNYAYQLVQAHACDKALPHLDHAIAASAKRPDLASMPVLLSGMCQESAGHPDLALARYVQVGEMCAKATCEPTITIQARFKEGALRYARGNRPQGLALVREARRAYDEKHMATDAKEVDAWFAAHHEKAAD